MSHPEDDLIFWIVEYEGEQQIIESTYTTDIDAFLDMVIMSFPDKCSRLDKS